MHHHTDAWYVDAQHLAAVELHEYSLGITWLFVD